MQIAKQHLHKNYNRALKMQALCNLTFCLLRLTYLLLSVFCTDYMFSCCL